MNYKNKNSGSILLLVLVFSGIFLVLFGGTIGFIFTQHKLQIKKAIRESSMQIAESGAEYYKWFLAHNPNDLEDGTGAPGPYEHEYFDPEGGAIGKFSLEISGVSECGTVSAIDITSTGWNYDDPSLVRRVKARYARPSVAEFAYIINDNVWAGADRDIKGKYHSNGGIRMDGANDSLVTSAQTTWNCVPSFGCSGPYEVQPGVFGSGAGQGLGLWQYPVEPIDFNGIVLDLAQMKSLAQGSGIYLPESQDINSSGRGYHVIFRNDGTFDVYIVTGLQAFYAYDSTQGYYWNYERITSESFYQNYAFPGNCSLVFLEDDLWLEGIVKGKVTIASADLINPNTDTNIILNGNIIYTTLDGSDGLLAIGENKVSIPLYSPDQMKLQGIFMAQKGRFGRDHYYCGWYFPQCDRDRLEISGSIVSFGRVGTKWSYSGGGFASGYRNRENTYDRKLMTSPPPMTPSADDEYTFVKWEEAQ